MERSRSSSYAVDGTTAVEEADLIFVCKTQYTQDMKPECFDVKEMMRMVSG